MTFDAIDFGELYRAHMARAGGRSRTSADWDARAPAMSRGIFAGAYVEGFLARMDLSGCSTLLDVGCGPGTIALSVAPRLQHVYGLDYSPGMLEAFEAEARARGIAHATPILHSWSDVWADVPTCDIVVASRSSQVDDLEGALEKLDAHAIRRVYLTLLAGGRFFEPAIYDALGRNDEPMPDLRVASLNVERAQALYRVQRGALLPGVGAQATADVTRVPEKLSGNDDAATSEQYTAVIGMPSWEVDLFGRLRSLKAAALEQYFATGHARAGAQVSLVAAVAATYLQLAADRESLDLSRATLAAQQSSLGLIERSLALGVATGLDVAQARSQVDVARADVALFEGAVAIDRHALDLVVGAAVTDDLLPARVQDVTDAVDLPADMSSAVLLNRPDILAAEARLKAANASIGAARAAFFPRISLTAGLGSASADLARLLQSGTGTWSFAPQVVAPIFAGGTLRANLRAARVEREIAVAQYEQAIQVAFREVSDALSTRPALTAQHAAIASLVEQLSTAHRLSDARYRAGMDGYLGVLVAQRSLFAAQRSLVGVRLAEQVNQVALYKVLGGGVQ